MKTTANTLIEGYLKDLDHQLRGLPSNRRREILDQLREHITQARAALESETEADIRAVLERLGDPAEIAAEARERFGVPATKPGGTPWLEVIALVLLVVPFVGWVVGVVLLWSSRLWTTRDKLIGTLGGISWTLTLLGSLVVAVQGAAPVGSPVPVEVDSPPVGSVPAQPEGSGAVAVIVWVLPFVLSIATAVYLGIRLRAHANTAPATR